MSKEPEILPHEAASVICVIPFPVEVMFAVTVENSPLFQEVSVDTEWLPGSRALHTHLALWTVAA